MVDFILGIDGGGTGCRAALANSEGQVLGRGHSGAANIRTDLTGACAHIIEAANQALNAAGLDPELISHIPAVLGLAGTNIGPYRQQLQTLLPFRESRIESDAKIALEGAIGSHDGAIAIFGTGSVYMLRRNGVVSSTGGWGFQLGDQASGARLGRDLLEQTLLAYDDIIHASPLTRDIMAAFNNDPALLVEFTIDARPGDYGRFAPKLFDHAAQEDAVAQFIIGKAVADIEAVLNTLNLHENEPLCLLGGLAELYAPLLGPRYQALLQKPKGDALSGALHIAKRSFSHQPASERGENT
ncbi:BadF/BadG/BcrA/BcrD ATPase family protein [Aquamicrobium segne]|uniref:BadF/BadG/BcrA/BcrD ATPase family protein n=1 Tax=Aquamicrobium segne TaxID=469547 RepID=A0ABW0H2X5_9HYPH